MRFSYPKGAFPALPAPSSGRGLRAGLSSATPAWPLSAISEGSRRRGPGRVLGVMAGLPQRVGALCPSSMLPRPLEAGLHAVKLRDVVHQHPVGCALAQVAPGDKAVE